MNVPTFDADGYPSEDTLSALRDWPMTDSAGALDFLKAAWSSYGTATHTLTAHEGYLVHAEPDRKYLRVATGGWSGNESLIQAMREAPLGGVWMWTWQLSARGGLYIFAYQVA